jgi:hypothetical protein
MDNRLQELLVSGLLGQGLPTNRLSGLLQFGQTPQGAVTANRNMLAQGLRGMEGKTQVGAPTFQGILDAVAIGTSPVPLLGDLLGLGADLNRYANEPESRTPLNFGLTALGLLPVIPSLSAKMDKINKKPKGWVEKEIPISMIEHGESAMPGGKLSEPWSKALVINYSQRKTPSPPIELLPPDYPGGLYMISDGSHRFEAAKLRGQKTIKAYVEE